jgi:tight adherence protein B
MPAEVLTFLGMVFIAAMLLAHSTIAPIFGENRDVRKRMKRRLKMVEDAGPSVGATLLRENFLKELKPWERRLEAMPKMAALTSLLEQAGYKVPAYRILLLSLALALVGAAAGYLSTRMPAVGLVAGILGLALPVWKISRDRKKRFDRFEQQFPEALDIMIRGLKAGHPFAESLHVVSKELDGAVAQEFAIVFYDINFGGDVRRALLNLLERMPSVTVTAFVTSVLIQRETGGNLSELLGQLSKTIRARFSFQGKVKSASAEGRMSAWVLTLIPFVLAALLTVTTPGYMLALIKEPLGHQLIGAAFGLLLLGILWIKKLIRIDV